MDKIRKVSIYILIAYCIPYIFLAMYGDFTFGATWMYIVAIVIMTGLSVYCKKTERVFIAAAGNVLTFLTSCLFTLWLSTEDWGYYFMAFPALNSTIFYSLFMLLVQIAVLIVTKRNKER